MLPAPIGCPFIDETLRHHRWAYAADAYGVHCNYKGRNSDFCQMRWAVFRDSFYYNSRRNGTS